MWKRLTALFTRRRDARRAVELLRRPADEGVWWMTGEQIDAGCISADRIAVGTITATELALMPGRASHER